MGMDRDSYVSEIINKIQVFVFPRRLRMKEFFRDYDPLRSGRCTIQQFGRALSLAGIRLPEDMVEALSDHFTEEGPRVQRPQCVNYDKFCAVVDEVFSQGNPNPSQMTSSPSSTMLMSFVPRDIADEDVVLHLLHRIALLCKTRGVILKYCFTDFDRAPISSPSRVNPRRGGQVTINQFLRLFPFRKEMSDKDMQILVERYRTDSGDVHFQALHNDVSEVMNTEMPPFPTSDLVLRPDEAEWEHHTLNPVEKVQSKVVEKRVRMYEHFQDFDALRKGFCTVGQVKTVFTILNLAKEIDRVDFDQIVAQYMREDGMFCYADFCADVERAFTIPCLEKDPHTTPMMPDFTTTAPARRNKIVLTPGKRTRFAALEDKIRTRVVSRRMLLKPAFMDMDRTQKGHITKTQFARVMHMLGFELDENAISLLSAVYCDMGNHNDFNYVDFCQSVDPPPEGVEHVMPHEDLGSSAIFRKMVRPGDRAAVAAH